MNGDLLRAIGGAGPLDGQRRRFLRAGLAAAGGLMLGRAARGQERNLSKDEKSPAELIDAKARRAIDLMLNRIGLLDVAVDTAPIRFVTVTAESL